MIRDLLTAEEAGKLLEKATPGPWWHLDAGCWRPGVNGAQPVLTAQEAVFCNASDGRPCVALTGEVDDPRSVADAKLIAAAPTLARTVIALEADLAALRIEHGAVVGLLQATRGERDRLREEVESMRRLLDNRTERG